MTVSSRGTETFWELYRGLPSEVRESARDGKRLAATSGKLYALHFKKVGRNNWSMRVNLAHRALGKFAADGPDDTNPQKELDSRMTTGG